MICVVVVVVTRSSEVTVCLYIVFMILYMTSDVGFVLYLPYLDGS